jgi:hypothetical protein
MCPVLHAVDRAHDARLEERKALYERMDRSLGTGVQQLLGRVLAGGDADHPDPGTMPGLDIARSIAAGEAPVPVERLP